MSTHFGSLAREVGDDRVALSRTAPTALIESFAPERTTILPVTGGRTVWAAAPAGSTAVVATPNWLGLAEPLPAGNRWTGLRLSSVVEAAPELRDMFGEDASAIAAARRLAKRLGSQKGIEQYHRSISAPWFTVMAADPALVDHAVAGVAVSVLGARFPDIPGGVRIELDLDAGPHAIDGYASAVETAVAERNSTRP